MLTFAFFLRCYTGNKIDITSSYSSVNVSASEDAEAKYTAAQMSWSVFHASIHAIKGNGTSIRKSVFKRWDARPIGLTAHKTNIPIFPRNNIHKQRLNALYSRVSIWLIGGLQKNLTNLYTATTVMYAYLHCIRLIYKISAYCNWMRRLTLSLELMHRLIHRMS